MNRYLDLVEVGLKKLNNVPWVSDRSLPRVDGLNAVVLLPCFRMRGESTQYVTRAISACVLTCNEAKSIRRCLASVAFCNEILVIDSHSTDATRDIARAAGARVIERDWPGFRSQREFAIQAANHDWILFLDADEELSGAAIERIRKLRDSGTLEDYAGYWLPRRNRYYGRDVSWGDWRSDRGLRLFYRRQARVAGREIHEHVVVDGRTRQIDADVLHDSYSDLDDQYGKLSRYARLMADAWYREGRRASFLACVVNPLWRFVRGYILRGGFLDGWRGYAVALVEAHYVREKYLRLLVLEKTAGEISVATRGVHDSKPT